MSAINRSDVVRYVEKNIGGFHKARLESLEKLKLSEILQRKNPYLFKAKNILTAQDLVKALLDAHLSSSDEGIFGGFLEGLARFINGKVYGGKKSAAEGIDLEFDKDNIRYIVAIKSGPRWGNAQQVKKMRENFRQAVRILRTNNPGVNVVAVNGCCYGRDNHPQKDEYVKLCGQRFWEFISGDERLYLDIIEPLGHKAKIKNEEFLQAYARVINLFTARFIKDFCIGGKIDWEKLVRFNSSKHKREVPLPEA